MLIARDILTGAWAPHSSQDPFGKSKARQEDRDIAALFTVRYSEALAALRRRKFKPADKGVPLEWFEFERLIVDECHESLVLGEEDAERKAASRRARRSTRRRCRQEFRQADVHVGICPSSEACSFAVASR